MIFAFGNPDQRNGTIAFLFLTPLCLPLCLRSAFGYTAVAPFGLPFGVAVGLGDLSVPGQAGKMVGGCPQLSETVFLICRMEAIRYRTADRSRYEFELREGHTASGDRKRTWSEGWPSGRRHWRFRVRFFHSLASVKGGMLGGSSRTVRATRSHSSHADCYQPHAHAARGSWRARCCQ